MSSIDYTQSNALLLALEVDRNFKSKEPWILEFERNIQTARTDYDRENDDYDRRDRYPEKGVLEDRFQYWATVIRTFSHDQQQLIDFSGHCNQKLAQLKWALLD